MRRVFVSYSHRQGDWVLDQLCVALRAGGADVLVDRERFRTGHPLREQMDGLQARAERHVLVLSPDYLGSPYCMHELRTAVASDPGFSQGRVVPLLREACALPEPLAAAEVLYVDLSDAADAEPWRLLLDACGAELGCGVPHWLQRRRELAQALYDDRSVNLVVRGKPRWRQLIAQVKQDLAAGSPGVQLGLVDLDSGATASRRGLLQEVLTELGSPLQLPPQPPNEDLVAFTRELQGRPGAALVALQHFERAVDPKRDYGADLFSALRDLVSRERKLRLLIQSRRPFAQLLPPDHALSSLTQLEHLELGP